MAVGRGDKLHIPAPHRDLIRGGARSSAGVLAELIAGPLADVLTADGPGLASVLDVGCGEGWLTAELRERGLEALGVDGDPLDGVDQVVDFESGADLPDLGRFDLVTCLEVAEHVDAAHADRFVAWLCAHAPVVLFSAAVPGQGGDGHVNERPTGYWADLFAREGYTGSGALRWWLWDDDRVEWWYAQNLLLCWNGDREPLADVDGCPTVIHPGMWQHFHGTAGWVR
jgi:SAM-dependent methyltransferase